MPTLNEAPPAGHDIMVVDDLPANLKLLEDLLRGRGYKVRSFARGRFALASAEQKPPDLVLLDINMPEMDGYEVCRRLKASAACAAVPVIFLSALHEADDKVKGFACGGADYVTKPFQVEEVLARAEVQIELKRARQAERELLEHTLGGAVRSLAEMIQLISPLVAQRAKSVHAIAQFLAPKLGGADPWQVELASTLCLAGCVTLPDDAFARGYCGEPASREEEAMFRAHPENGARLLSKIPRLEAVAQAIRWQLEPAKAPAEAARCAGILQLAQQFDRRLYRGVPPGAALQQLRAAPEKFDPAALALLESYRFEQGEQEVRSLPLRDLRAEMVLEEDIVSAKGRVTILKQGTVLNHTWLERIANFARAQGVSEPVRVRVPKAAR